MGDGTMTPRTVWQPEKELLLDEMLEDPMTQALMLSDGTDAGAVKDLLIATRGRLEAAHLKDGAKAPGKRSTEER